MTESINYAVLDTACSSTVCSIDWLKLDIETLSEEKLRIEEKESETTFKFGDSNVFKSTKKVKFPVNIIGDRAKITADVVNCSIPLLFNKKSMKRAQMKLDLENGTALIHGKEVKMRCISSGNYCLPLWDEKEAWKKTQEIMLALGLGDKEK